MVTFGWLAASGRHIIETGHICTNFASTTVPCTAVKSLFFWVVSFPMPRTKYGGCCVYSKTGFWFGCDVPEYVVGEHVIPGIPTIYPRTVSGTRHVQRLPLFAPNKDTTHMDRGVGLVTSTSGHNLNCTINCQLRYFSPHVLPVRKTVVFNEIYQHSTFHKKKHPSKIHTVFYRIVIQALFRELISTKQKYYEYYVWCIRM